MEVFIRMFFSSIAPRQIPAFRNEGLDNSPSLHLPCGRCFFVVLWERYFMKGLTMKYARCNGKSTGCKTTGTMKG